MITMIVLLGLLGLYVLISIRLDHVAEFRHELIRKISDQSSNDLEQGLVTIDWRISIYQSVTYDKMLYQIWKPLKLEEFYSNTDFVMPSNKFDPSKYPEISHLRGHNA